MKGDKRWKVTFDSKSSYKAIIKVKQQYERRDALS